MKNLFIDSSHVNRKMEGIINTGIDTNKDFNKTDDKKSVIFIPIISRIRNNLATNCNRNINKFIQYAVSGG